MKNITLDNYVVIFEDKLDFLIEFIAEKGYSSVFILTDHQTEQLCKPLLNLPDAISIEIPEGESFKNLDTCQEVWEMLLKCGADRKSLLINLGGGVIGDMGGFIASCYMRGIDFIQVPTTLLSQVDASVGGKLAIDFKYAKNLIGLFKDPVLVFIHDKFLQTLPEQQYLNGWAEIFKHALIADKQLWNEIKLLSNLRKVDIQDIVFKNVTIKSEVVRADPFERGRRKILNFGHTIGHAIEALSLKNDEHPLLHGEAVVIGIICEAFLSHQYGTLHEDELEEIIRVLQHHYTGYPLNKLPFSEIWNFMLMDKKNNKGAVLACLLDSIGQASWDHEISEEQLKEAIQFYIQIFR